MPKKEVREASRQDAPKQIACGSGYIWSLRKSGYTPWRKTAWDAGTEAEDLSETFSKATEAAAKEWVKAAQCVNLRSLEATEWRIA